MRISHYPKYWSPTVKCYHHCVAIANTGWLPGHRNYLHFQVSLCTGCFDKSHLQIQSRLAWRRGRNSCTWSKWIILQSPSRVWAWRRLRSKHSVLESKLPQRGQPSSSTPLRSVMPLVMPTLWATTAGNSRRVESPEGQKTSHFARYKCRPKAGKKAFTVIIWWLVKLIRPILGPPVHRWSL